MFYYLKSRGIISYVHLRVGPGGGGKLQMARRGGAGGGEGK